MSQTLTGAFLNMLDSVDSIAQVKTAAKAYPSCLAQHGVTATGHDDLIQRVTAAYGTTAAPAAAQPASTAWLAAQDAERRAATADATCRKPIYDIAMTLVEPKLAGFTKNHSTDFAVLAQQWDDMIAQASKYPEFR